MCKKSKCSFSIVLCSEPCTAGCADFALSILVSRQIIRRSKTNVTSAQQMFPCYLYISDCGQLPTSAPTNDTNLNVRKFSISNLF